MVVRTYVAIIVHFLPRPVHIPTCASMHMHMHMSAYAVRVGCMFMHIYLDMCLDMYLELC